nr:MAG TPA: hypothetical protein [Caudoviricetes sp.]
MTTATATELVQLWRLCILLSHPKGISPEAQKGPRQ